MHLESKLISVYGNNFQPGRSAAKKAWSSSMKGAGIPQEALLFTCIVSCLGK